MLVVRLPVRPRTSQSVIMHLREIIKIPERLENKWAINFCLYVTAVASMLMRNVILTAPVIFTRAHLGQIVLKLVYFGGCGIFYFDCR